MELLDIVDEHDNVIGQMPFREAHDKRALHRFCRVLLQNSEGEFILQVRAEGIPDAGKYDAPGGHVEAGESYLETATRELTEEMGVTIEKEAFVELGRIEDRHRPHVENMIGKAFVATHDGPYEIQETEVAGLEIFTKDELLNKVENDPESFSPKLHKTLKLWVEQNG